MASITSHDEQRLIVGVYVDDLIITGGDMEVFGRFKREMSKNFKMSDIGVLSYYLGIEVQQSTIGITICQSVYAKKLLDTTGLADSNPTRTPMEGQLQLRKADTMTTVNATNYRSIFENLCYLVNTRPNLAYSVGYVSRFMEAPRKEHPLAVKRILRYVAGTRGWGVRYCARKGKEKLELVGYSDSDMAGDVDDRKSTSGMIYFLSGARDLLAINKTKGSCFVFLRSRIYRHFDGGNTGGLACATDGRTHRKRKRSTNAIRGQQSYDLPDKKSSFARPEQEHRNQIQLHLRMCRSKAHQD